MTDRPTQGGITPEQIAASDAARARADSDNPAVILEALLPRLDNWRGHKINRLTLTGFLALKKLNSPLLKNREPGSDEGVMTDVTLEDCITALFVMIKSPAEVRSLLEDGEECLREAALSLVDDVSLAEGQEIPRLVLANLVRSADTLLPSGSAEAGEGVPLRRRAAGSAGRSKSPTR